MAAKGTPKKTALMQESAVKEILMKSGPAQILESLIKAGISGLMSNLSSTSQILRGNPDKQVFAVFATNS